MLSNIMLCLNHKFIYNQQAEQRILDEGLDHEYAPISGFPAFTAASAALAFGDDSYVIKDGLVSWFYSEENSCPLKLIDDVCNKSAVVVNVILFW